MSFLERSSLRNRAEACALENIGNNRYPGDFPAIFSQESFFECASVPFAGSLGYCDYNEIFLHHPRFIFQSFQNDYSRRILKSFSRSLLSTFFVSCTVFHASSGSYGCPFRIPVQSKVNRLARCTSTIFARIATVARLHENRCLIGVPEKKRKKKLYCYERFVCNVKIHGPRRACNFRK